MVSARNYLLLNGSIVPCLYDLFDFSFMKKPAKKTPARKRKEVIAWAKSHRGKQHPLHAESLDHLAEAMMDAHYFVLAAIFRGEAIRVRAILR